MTEQTTLLKQTEVEKMIGFKKDFIFRNIKKDKFPKPIKFGKMNRWRLSDIENWIESNR